MNGDSFTHGSRADTFSHAGAILEYGAVLDLIASRCANPGAREKVRALRPTADARWIDERLMEIDEVREYHAASGRLPIADTACGEAIERAARKRETMTAEALVALSAAERSVVALQRSMSDETRYPMLRGIVSLMAPHRELSGAIDRAIDPDATIKDTASARLQSLRRSVLRAREDLRRHAETLAKSYGSADYATYTGTRHLLLVPRDKCRKKEGIVHSASHSGGSLYFEPFTLVEKNNALETLLQDERAEQARILAELTERVAALAGELLGNIGLWERLDVLEAKARFAAEFRCASPARSDDGRLRLAAARHPLLELSLRRSPGGRPVVPLDLALGAGGKVLVITGPNAGGKTVCLKTLGLAVLMFQSGLPVACGEGTVLPLFQAVHADIGDEQSIATSLSTFTSHLKQLDAMCRTADAGTLCLVDEIGDGTDPDEGSALAIATIERLRSLGATVIATTHYGKVKAYALRTDGVENASMAYDDANDEPLYRLLQGTAGRSRGIETARRLGFDASVVSHAESLIGEEPYRLETVLSQLEATQIALERERAALRARTAELDRLVASYGEKEAALSKFKAEQEERVKREAEELIVRARREIEGLVKKIRESQAGKPATSEAHRRVREMLEEVRARPEPVRLDRVAEGDAVSLSPEGRPSGRVIAVGKDSVTVEIGGKRLSVKKENLYRAAADGVGPAVDAPVTVDAEPIPAANVDVRGMTREEALETVDRFLDRAVLAGSQELCIIHGVGEGVLLRSVRDLVRSDARVASSRQGTQGEGGLGVTVVRLK